MLKSYYNMIGELGIAQIKNELKGSLRRLRRVEERFLFDMQLNRCVPVLVYQMGKVASSSIVRSLKEVYPGVVLHCHSLSRDYLSQDKVWRARRLYERVISRKKPINVISLTREPIGRNISAFFQNFERDTGVPYRESNFSLMELKKVFLENYNHNIPLVWFNENIKSHFGIDVYATQFPDCGYATYNNHEGVRLLVMRSEISDDMKVSAVSDFLGIPRFQLKNKNIGLEKQYAETYRLFREEVKLPSDYVNQMCDSKYFNHFYGRDTIESVRKKWSDTLQRRA